MDDLQPFYSSVSRLCALCCLFNFNRFISPPFEGFAYKMYVLMPMMALFGSPELLLCFVFVFVVFILKMPFLASHQSKHRRIVTMQQR